MKATLSIAGIYNVRTDIFDLLVLPDAGRVETTSGFVEYPAVNADLIKSLILTECNQLSLVDTFPDYLKTKIGIWSAKNLDSWIKQYRTLFMTYNPLENYDRVEKGKDVRTPDINRTHSYDNVKDIMTRGSGVTTTVTNDSSAFNSATLTTDGKSVTDSQGKGNDINTRTGSESYAENGTDTTSHDLRVHGNIGVTTSQQMLISERDVALYNFYDVVVESFKSEFCLMIW